jgi:aspartyl-tRNA(Asn)/glutamyl-tRNA(Gln) amidotransferase subunit A
MEKEDSFEEKVIEKLERIKEKNEEYGVFIEVYENEAINTAKKLDEKIKKGGKLGKLGGTIIAVKNNISISGKKLTCASRMLENYNAPYNASVIEKILNEDGIIIGSTNLDEFACGSTTTNSAFFVTKNPHDPERIVGGSSGGSAAAVALDMCDVALGTDTGGSIRCPAAFCGIFGFKPTYGSVSRFGLVDMAMSLEQIGTFGKSIDETRLLFEVIRGYDEKDPTTYAIKNENNKEKEEKKEKIKNGEAKVGVVKEFLENLDENVFLSFKRKMKDIEKKFEIVEISLPLVKYSVPIYYLTMAAEFSSAMQRYDGLRYGAEADRELDLFESYFEVRKVFGKEVKRRIILGTYITTKEFKEKWYSITLKARMKLKKEFEKIFSSVDFLISPTMPCLPWKIGEKLKPIEIYMSDILTVNANLVGCPALNVPIEKFIGLQILGKNFEDENVFEFAKAIKW